MTLALETLGGNEALDLGGLGVVLLALTGHGATDDKFADIILLLQGEEVSDLGGTLGAEALGDNGVSETGELSLALSDNAEGHDSQVGSGDGCNNKSVI